MGITIFLVDDHQVLLDGLQLLLGTQADFQLVGTALDGRAAVQQVARVCPDVVIIDITMPELNGIEAMRQIHVRCPRTRFLILSMHGATKHILSALQAGAHGYLLKGSASAEVIQAVRAVHAGRTYLTRKISDPAIDAYLRQPDHNNGADDPLALLSEREREVLQLVVEGRSSAEIATSLCLSLNTVKTYRSRLMEKLNLNDVPSLVRFAIQQGLTPSD